MKEQTEKLRWGSSFWKWLLVASSSLALTAVPAWSGIVGLPGVHVVRAGGATLYVRKGLAAPKPHKPPGWFAKETQVPEHVVLKLEPSQDQPDFGKVLAAPPSVGPWASAVADSTSKQEFLVRWTRVQRVPNLFLWANPLRKKASHIPARYAALAKGTEGGEVSINYDVLYALGIQRPRGEGWEGLVSKADPRRKTPTFGYWVRASDVVGAPEQVRVTSRRGPAKPTPRPGPPAAHSVLVTPEQGRVTSGVKAATPPAQPEAPAARSKEAHARKKEADVTIAQAEKSQTDIGPSKCPSGDDALAKAKALRDAGDHPGAKASADKAAEAFRTYKIEADKNAAMRAIAKAENLRSKLGPGKSASADGLLDLASKKFGTKDYAGAHTDAKLALRAYNDGLRVAADKAISQARELQRQVPRGKVPGADQALAKALEALGNADSAQAVQQALQAKQGYAQELERAKRDAAKKQVETAKPHKPVPTDKARPADEVKPRVQEVKPAPERGHTPSALRALASSHHWPAPKDASSAEEHAKEQIDKARTLLGALKASAQQWELARDLAECYASASPPQTSIADCETLLVAEPPKTDLAALLETWKRQAEAPELAFDLDYIRALGARLSQETRDCRARALDGISASQRDMRRNIMEAEATLTKALGGHTGHGTVFGAVRSEFTKPTLAELDEAEKIIERLRAATEPSGWERKDFDHIDKMWHEVRMGVKSALANTRSGENFLMAGATHVELVPEQHFAVTGRVSRALKDGRDYWRICPTNQRENLIKVARLPVAKHSEVEAQYRGENDARWSELPEARSRMATARGVLWLRFEGEGEYQFKCQGERATLAAEIDEAKAAPPLPGRKPMPPAGPLLTPQEKHIRGKVGQLCAKADECRTSMPGLPSAESAVKKSEYYLKEEDFKNATTEATRAITLYAAHSSKESGTGRPTEQGASATARWRAFISAHHWPEPAPQADQGSCARHAQEQVQQAQRRLAALQAIAHKWERLAGFVPKLLEELGESAPRLVSYGEIAWVRTPPKMDAAQLFADWQTSRRARPALDMHYVGKLRERLASEAVGRWREQVLSRYRRQLSELECRAKEAEAVSEELANKKGMPRDVARAMAPLIERAKAVDVEPVRATLDQLEKDADMRTWDLTVFQDIGTKCTNARALLGTVLNNAASGPNFVQEWATELRVKPGDHKQLTGTVSVSDRDTRDYLLFRADSLHESIRLRLVSVTGKPDGSDFVAWYQEPGSRRWVSMSLGEEVRASGLVLVLIDGTAKYTFACLGAQAGPQTRPEKLLEEALSH